MPEKRQIQGGAALPVFLQNSINAGNECGLGSIVIMDVGIAAIHQGWGFRFCHYVASIAAGATHDILWDVGARSCHATSRLAVGASARIQVWFRPTITNLGTPIPIYNLNLGSLNEPTTRAFDAPTVGATGSILIRDEFSPGGATGAAIGSASRDNTELLIPTLTQVLVRITNLGVAAVVFSYTGDFYEEM